MVKRPRSFGSVECMIKMQIQFSKDEIVQTQRTVTPSQCSVANRAFPHSQQRVYSTQQRWMSALKSRRATQ